MVIIRLTDSVSINMKADGNKRRNERGGHRENWAGGSEKCSL